MQSESQAPQELDTTSYCVAPLRPPPLLGRPTMTNLRRRATRIVQFLATSPTTGLTVRQLIVQLDEILVRAFQLGQQLPEMDIEPLQAPGGISLSGSAAAGSQPTASHQVDVVEPDDEELDEEELEG